MALPWHSARAAFREGKGPCMELAFQSQPRTLRFRAPGCTDRFAIALGNLEMHQRMIGVDPMDDHHRSAGTDREPRIGEAPTVQLMSNPGA